MGTSRMSGPLVLTEEGIELPTGKVLTGGLVVPSGETFDVEDGVTAIAQDDPAAWIQSKEVTYTEVGAGVYTGEIVIPAGATLLDIIVHGVALWTAATSAALIVGDSVDPDGWFLSINLKATALLAGESINLTHSGGLAGAYNVGTNTHWMNRYHVAEYTIVGEVTSVGAGTAGRTRMTAIYSLPLSVEAAVFVGA